MSDFEFDSSDFIRMINETEKRIKKNTIKKMRDSVDDLGRISFDIAPIDESTLRKSQTKEVKVKDGVIEGEVTFSVTENNNTGSFNYAYWTHEIMDDSQLGEVSSDAPGTDGYTVGNKYLERPLKGESDKYIDWLNNGVNEGIDE
jgi:hypothetical protein